jgi:anaphase-promoting complex subunit 1
LLGHLKVLAVPDICDYLTQGLETTTVAILIGVATSKIGSADSVFSKTLCLHLPPLLPAQHCDIEISPIVQCAALIGLGFLYCRSGHRLMVEFLLEELSRMPTTDRCENRESLALSAAWALGLVLLPVTNLGSKHMKRNETLHDLIDLRIEDRLNLFIIGGERPNGSKLFQPIDNADIAAKSSRIMEHEIINTEITAPAACIALALIYMRSNHSKVLRFIALPKTVNALDNIRPDILFYYTLAESLIIWDTVEPTAEWIDSRTPRVILASLNRDAIKAGAKSYINPYDSARRSNQVLSPATAFLLQLNITTGYCMGIGLIYAGTFHLDAKELIVKKLKELQR